MGREVNVFALESADSHKTGPIKSGTRPAGSEGVVFTSFAAPKPAAQPESHPVRTPCDPTRHPAALTLPFRAFPATERALQRLCAAEGLTFWGEAIGLIFDLYAKNPTLADLSDLEFAPRGLTSRGGAIRHAGAAPTRGIMTPLSRAAATWISGVAASKRMGLERTAALVLHRHAESAVALILADKMGRE